MTTRNERRHPPKEEYQFVTPLVELLNQIIADTEKELAFTRVNEWSRTREVANPVNMGVTQAENELGLFQKHGVFLEEKIRIIKEFIKAKEI